MLDSILKQIYYERIDKQLIKRLLYHLFCFLILFLLAIYCKISLSFISLIYIFIFSFVSFLVLGIPNEAETHLEVFHQYLHILPSNACVSISSKF
jgi:hypothetical protein